MQPIEALGLYLEDSYFLGVRVRGNAMRLRVLFALMSDHASYAPPLPGEQHCFREGDIVLNGLTVTDWVAARPVILTDPDGSLDLGSIEVAGQDGRYRVITEWFDLTCQADSLAVILD